jgi:hypothetical protein
VAEIIPITQGLLAMMRQNGVAAAREYCLRQMGGLTLGAHAAEKVFAGLVDPRDAEQVVGPIEGDCLTGLWEIREGGSTTPP